LPLCTLLFSGGTYSGNLPTTFYFHIISSVSMIKNALFSLPYSVGFYTTVKSVWLLLCKTPLVGLTRKQLSLLLITALKLLLFSKGFRSLNLMAVALFKVDSRIRVSSTSGCLLSKWMSYLYLPPPRLSRTRCTWVLMGLRGRNFTRNFRISSGPCTVKVLSGASVS